MRIVVQRVSEASVKVDDVIVGSISKGYVILLGVGEEDTQEDLEYLVRKIIGLRVFADEAGKMNQSIIDIEGEILVISQFTLFASTKKGNRPSFVRAGAPDKANEFYEAFIAALKREKVKKVESGVFGADMKVSLVNDGPVTIIMDSKQKEY